MKKKLVPPGSGKSHLSKIILAYALSNGLVYMVTSLAARHANKKKANLLAVFLVYPYATEVEKTAEALLKLMHDPKP